MLLGIGLVGFFVLPWFLSGTMAWLILLALGLSVGLVLYGLFHIPVNPGLPARPAAKDGGSDDHGGGLAGT